MIVTRATSDLRLGAKFHRQVFGTAQPLLLASGVLFALAAFPGLPKIPFLLMGGGLGTAAWRMRKKVTQAEKAEAAAKPAAAKESLEALLRVEPLAVEIGLGLVKLVDGGVELG